MTADVYFGDSKAAKRQRLLFHGKSWSAWLQFLAGHPRGCQRSVSVLSLSSSSGAPGFAGFPLWVGHWGYPSQRDRITPVLRVLTVWFGETGWPSRWPSPHRDARHKTLLQAAACCKGTARLAGARGSCWQAGMLGDGEVSPGRARESCLG